MGTVDGGRKRELTPLNRRIWGAILEYAKRESYLEPLSRIASVLNIEPKTARERFENGETRWSLKDLRDIRRETKDHSIVDAIVQYMNEEEE